MRHEPSQHKWHAFTLFYRELGDRRQVLAARLNRRPQNKSVRASNRLQSVSRLTDPGNDQPVVESNNQLHLHSHFPA